MEAPNFSQFASNVRDIARSNRFLFELTGIFSANLPANFKYHVKAATIPKLEINGPEIKYRGTKMFLRGDIKKDPLQVTFYADTDWIIRNFFETWMKTLVQFDHRDNKRSSMKNTRFGTNILIGQYSGMMDRPIVQYSYSDVAPYELSEMGVDQSTSDGLLEFSVTFHYSFWSSSELPSATTFGGGNA